MSLSVMLKSYVAASLQAAGYTDARLSRISPHSFTILMYHRVLPRHRVDSSTQAGMYVTPETFELHIRFLENHFDIVPFSRLLSGAPPRPLDGNHTRRPTCALTFDDGWADFYEFAFPILKSHGIPALIFLPTNYIGTTNWFWTDRVGHLLRHWGSTEDRSKAGGTAPAASVVLQLESMRAGGEDRLESAIGLLKRYRNEEIDEILSELSDRWNVSSQPPGRAFLSWEEVDEMARSGLVSYGSHTAGHKILTTLTEREIQDELGTSRQHLLARGVVESPAIPFSYPNGDHTSRIAELVRDAGYSSAVITRQGWNSATADPFTLLRIGVHQDMASSEAMLACRLLEIF